MMVGGKKERDQGLTDKATGFSKVKYIQKYRIALPHVGKRNNPTDGDL